MKLVFYSSSILGVFVAIIIGYAKRMCHVIFVICGMTGCTMFPRYLINFTIVEKN